MNPEDQAFVESLDEARRNELLSEGVVSAYKLVGLCTWLAAYDVAPSLHPKYCTGLMDAKLSLERIKKDLEEALAKFEGEASVSLQEATEKAKVAEQSLVLANEQIHAVSSDKDRLLKAAE